MPTVDPSKLEAVMEFRGAYGRLCLLAAHALMRTNATREDVSTAFQGRGTLLPYIRVQRVEVNMRLQLAKHALAKVGVVDNRAARLLIHAAREARDAVEQEWNVQLPILNPNP